MTHECSRRLFLQSASLLAALGSLSSLRAGAGASAGANAGADMGIGAGTVTGAVAGAAESAGTQNDTSRGLLREFDYSNVRLTGGPLKSQYDFIHAHYVGLDNDRLLKVYRRRAGLSAPGADMGGWYDASGFVPGHSLGQFISGLARIGSCTGDDACHRKVHELVDGFGAALAANSNPFAGPSSMQVWPAYVMDKHTIGLIDAYRLSGMESARALLPKMMDGALPFVSPVSRDRIGKKDPPYDETYVLPENLFGAYEITGDRRYYDLAVKYLLNPEYFDPLARGEDVLAGKHAYSHTIALSSAAKAYLTVGEPRYKSALENAWKFLDLQRYASGGFGPDEQFVTPHQGALYESLFKTQAHFETPCGSYASMKLSRYLLRFTGNARYGDGLERVVYNALLGVKRPDNDGNYPYYSSYNSGATKEYYAHKWPCCSGTLVQGVADYVLNIYFQSADGLYVNLYTPSQVRWLREKRPVTLVQETNYPADDLVALRVETQAPEAFTLHLRIPGWLTESPRITVNGRAMRARAEAGTFAAIERTWRNGDRIELKLPQSFRTEAIDDRHPETVAVMRGPLLYAGLDPWPEVSTTPLPLPAGLKPAGGQAETYVQNINGKPLRFVPLFKVQDQPYNTYFQRA